MDRIERIKRDRKRAIIADRVRPVLREAGLRVARREVVRDAVRSLEPDLPVRSVRADVPKDRPRLPSSARPQQRRASDWNVRDDFQVIEGVRRLAPSDPVQSLHAGSRLSSLVDDVRKKLVEGCKERPKDNRRVSGGGGGRLS